ncbi:5-carboxymethyl-2-hydroxymuconate isomerase [Shewanella sp. UCD-FRSSP16_17]|uniref:5-carboxymethyl-2-hydroxymuconate Delta-isomerase n=1 Tax=Shewanella sp. UCD-FRSSP16_17 TaxID=1853256 RepID=UPI0007EEA77D|nr:5-carboxymethyl-2-hydroxymuconate Delta-isomerase [Shewanella sp. UCD-FRSSP16_17]OBT08317.1 5-carboxymethyl-2-hydroxymuconate isomerase [Shewanella sp. UCD-FRSSP16_17]
MPHCIVEHSAKLNGQALVDLVHQGALTSELFQAQGSDIKVRAIPYSEFKTGNVDISFVHVTMRILSGRNDKQKTMLTQRVLNQLQTLIKADCSLSVEVVDIERETYSKVVV